jgi:hypothetical protein
VKSFVDLQPKALEVEEARAKCSLIEAKAKARLMDADARSWRRSQDHDRGEPDPVQRTWIEKKHKMILVRDA